MTKPKSAKAGRPENQAPLFESGDRSVVPRDILLFPMLLSFGVVTWLLPERWWRGVARGLAAILVVSLARRTKTQMARTARVMDARTIAHSPRELEVARTAFYLEDRMQVVAAYRPGAWEPKIELSGREHLDRSLAEGRGAILWISDFTSSSLVTKLAFHRAGIPVSHLSRPTHGFSSSRFGIRFINPIRTRIEDRYVGERVTMPNDTAVAPFRVLRKRLKANQVVSITVGLQARKTRAVPFLSGCMQLATGPINLARSARAPLLPIFTVRNESGAYEVHIGEALHVAVDGGREDAFDNAIGQYARSLERFVVRFPAQWRGWPHVREVR